MAHLQDTAVLPEGRKRAEKNLTQDALLRRQVEATKKLLEVTERKVKAIEESKEIELMVMRTKDTTEEAKEYFLLKQAMALSKVRKNAAAILFPESVGHI